MSGFTNKVWMSGASCATECSPRGLTVLYPNLYAWYILAATLDVVVTHTILHYLNGEEVNKIADALIQRFGVVGMVGLKYSSIVLVVGICEFVGRRRFQLGRRLAVIAIALSVFPVGVGLIKVVQWSSQAAPIVMLAECEGVDSADLAVGRPFMRSERAGAGLKSVSVPTVPVSSANLASW